MMQGPLCGVQSFGSLGGGYEQASASKCTSVRNGVVVADDAYLHSSRALCAISLRPASCRHTCTQAAQPDAF
jgi:hypothetical protein